MTFKMSYILKNKIDYSEKAEKTEKTIYLSTWTIKDTIMHQFGLVTDECEITDLGILIRILVTNSKSLWYGISICIHIIPNNTFMDVSINGDEKRSILVLQQFDSKMNEYVEISAYNGSYRCIKEEYNIIKTYDDVSSYYGRLLYPKLNEFDRKLRLLLYNTYYLAYGNDFAKKFGFFSANGRLKEKSKKNKDDRTCTDNIFYEYDYTQLIDILFGEKGSCYQNLSKSDWEIFFADKIPDLDFESDIEELKEYRNNIAHCKLITKQDYDCTTKIFDKYLNAFDRAIELTYSKDFMTNFFKSLNDSLNRISQIYKKV